MNPQPPPQSGRDPTQEFRVLACIPEGRVRGLFSVLLADEGHAVTACEDPGAATRHLQEKAADLCIVQATENADPAPVMRAARIKNPNTRILLLSEHACADRLPPLFRLGVDEFLFIPANSRRCLEVLQKLRAPADGGTGEHESRPVLPPERGAQPARRETVSTVTSGLSTTSPLMRKLLEQLRDVPGIAPGIILHGEAGCEFELVAREYHKLRGGESGCLPALPAARLSGDSLRDLIAMTRLSSEPVCTLHLPDLDSLTDAQLGQLGEVLAEERRRRHRGKPLAFVFSLNEVAGDTESPLLKELRLHTQHALKIPPLRDRPEDLDTIAQHVLGELSILYPSSEVRALEAGAREWLRMQLWPRNHAEFVELLRTVVLSCKDRTLGAMSLARHFAENAVVS